MEYAKRNPNENPNCYKIDIQKVIMALIEKQNQSGWYINLNDVLVALVDDDTLLEYCINEYDPDSIVDAIVSKKGMSAITSSVTQKQLLDEIDHDKIMEFVLDKIDYQEYGFRLIRYQED